MFGSSGRRDGFESSSTRGSLDRSGCSEDARRGSKDGGGSDTGGNNNGSPGMGIRLETSVETGLRVELNFPGSRSPRAGGSAGSESGAEKESAAVAEERDSPHGGRRGEAKNECLCTRNLPLVVRFCV